MSRQLALPLEQRADPESALMHAWSRTRLRVPYDVAIRNPALAICLRNIAAARARAYPEMQPWTREEPDPVEPLFSS